MDVRGSVGYGNLLERKTSIDGFVSIALRLLMVIWGTFEIVVYRMGRRLARVTKVVLKVCFGGFVT